MDRRSRIEKLKRIFQIWKKLKNKRQNKSLKKYRLKEKEEIAKIPLKLKKAEKNILWVR